MVARACARATVLVLIKSVAQEIPIYSMSCFRLPIGLCQQNMSLIRNFWWGIRNGKKRTCWVAWEDMTQPKADGGLGFDTSPTYR
jgi:hypothetical protein